MVPNSKHFAAGALSFILMLLCLSCKETAQPNATPLTEPALMPMYVTAKDGLKLRQEPKFDGKIVALLSYQQKIHIVPPQGPEFSSDGVRGRWAKARYQNLQGYVFSGFLTASADDFCINLRNQAEIPKNNALCIGRACADTDGCLDGSAFFPDGTADLLRSCHRILKGSWRANGQEILAEAIFYSAKDAPFYETDCRDICKAEACIVECMKTAQVTRYELKYTPDKRGTFYLTMRTVQDKRTTERTSEEGCLRLYAGRRK